MYRGGAGIGSRQQSISQNSYDEGAQISKHWCLSCTVCTAMAQPLTIQLYLL